MPLSLILLASIPGGIGIVLLAWSRWGFGRPVAVVLSRIVGAILVGLGVSAVVLWAWATTATDTSQFARALIWGDSDVGDVDRFPTRTVRAGPEVRRFEPNLATATIDQFRPDTANDADRDGDDEEGIETFSDLLAFNDTTAFIILRDDELLYEQYFNGATDSTIHTSFSIAKSFVATLIGIALEEDRFVALNDSVTDYVPELARRDSRFSQITLRHLLTMSSGLTFDDGWEPWADPAESYYATDLRKSGLERPSIETPPGLVFDYNDWNTVLLTLVLEEVGQVTVSELLQTRIWQPMGAEADASWSLDSTKSGFERAFVGINATAMDFARFGALYRDDGRVGGTQIVPADFVDEATRASAQTDPTARYQYQWWVDVDNNGYYAEGDHCQYIYVDPASNTVFTRMGNSCGDIEWPGLFAELADWISPRVE